MIIMNEKTTRPLTERFTFSLPIEEKDELYKLAIAERRSISGLIGYIIMDYLERRKKQQK